MSTLNGWPDHRNSVVPSAEYVHAIGMISLHFNYVERQLFLLGAETLSLGDAAMFAMAKLNNVDRIALLRRRMSEVELMPDVRSALAHALDSFVICADNRNVVMHSVPDKVTDEGNLKLTKQSRKLDFRDLNVCEVSLHDLRRCADDIGNLAHLMLDLQFSDLLGQMPTGPWTTPQRLVVQSNRV